MAGVGGTIFAIGLVLLLEQMRRGFRNAEEVEQATSLPTIGLLPKAEPTIAWSARNFEQVQKGKGTVDFDRLLGSPGLPYISSLRSIHARLRRSSKSQPNEVLLVLSALSGEGKSRFACDLALVSASTGMRTLLIDGDFYSASASRNFNLDGPGLREAILTRETTFWSAIKRNLVRGFSVLNSGSGSMPSWGFRGASSACLCGFVETASQTLRPYHH